MRTLLWTVLMLLGAAVMLVWAVLPVTPEPPDLAGERFEGELETDGLSRRYEVWVPESAGEGAPLLFVLHGSSMDAESTRALTHYAFERLAHEQGVVLVYPEGFEREWNGCRAPGVSEADRLDLDDTGFLLRLADWLVREHGIDARRVYAAGISNGGQMAYRLAHDAPDRVAAIAAVIAQTPAPENSKCNPPGGAVPVLILNGDADPIIPYEGGIASLFGLSARGRVLSARDTAEHHARRNGLGGAPRIESLPDTDPHDATRVTRRTWIDDAGKPRVVLVTVHGGGHAFPGGAALGLPWLTGRWLGRTSRDIDGAQEIWRFLRVHRLDRVGSIRP